MNLQWICYHIYYHGDQDVLLKEGVFPIVNILNEKKLLKGFFFLRYWKKGPHLRVRLLANINNHAEMQALFVDLLTLYLKKYPSDSSLDVDTYKKMIENLSSDDELNYETLCENNSFECELYSPEFEKYGGKAGVAIAESVFMVSSSMVETLFMDKNYDAKKKLGNAFLMMSIALAAFDFGVRDYVQFFNGYFNYWRYYNTRFSLESSVLKWDEYYNLQKSLLSKITVHCVSGLLNDQNLNASLRTWFDCLSKAKMNLHEIPLEKEIQFSNFTQKIDPVHYLLMNYLHTHNNRHGVLVHEEAFLGYIGLKTYSELIGRT